MAISRRGFLAVAGAGVAAAAVEVGTSAGRLPVVHATDAPAPASALAVPGRGLAGGVTTLDQTVVKGPVGNLGYRNVVPGPGEAHVVRKQLSGYRHPTLALGAFVQMTDLHIIDDQSPLRVEFTDRLADPPNARGFGTESTYRP